MPKHPSSPENARVLCPHCRRWQEENRRLSARQHLLQRDLAQTQEKLIALLEASHAQTEENLIEYAVLCPVLQ